MNAKAAAARRQRGFTLLEVTLVLLLVGIILAFAVPRLPGLSRTNLEASADRLAATMTYLADEAALRGRIYRLTLDLEDDRWSIAALAPYARVEGTSDGAAPPEAQSPEFREDPDDPMVREMELPDDVFFDAVLDRDGESLSGTRVIYFLPEGLTESLSVRLRENDGATALVQLSAARGSARREDTEEAVR